MTHVLIRFDSAWFHLYSIFYTIITSSVNLVYIFRMRAVRMMVWLLLLSIAMLFLLYISCYHSIFQYALLLLCINASTLNLSADSFAYLQRKKSNINLYFYKKKEWQIQRIQRHSNITIGPSHWLTRIDVAITREKQCSISQNTYRINRP